jgi:Endoplasmic reticulum-based factor for assembly of V-ATPase
MTTTTMMKSNNEKTPSSSTAAAATATATTTAPTYARPPPSYTKKLEGVEATPALKELWILAWNVVANTTTNSNNASTSATASSISNSNMSTTTSGTNHNTNNVLHEASRRLTVDEAKRTILFQSKMATTTESEISQQNCVPIPIIRAMEALFMMMSHDEVASSSSNKNDDKNKKSPAWLQLQQELQNSKLVYTPPPVLSAQQQKERQRFVQRMDRLQLKDEERHYNKLTSNLKTRASKMAEDDAYITTKSMTYAASIGLNMIIAPLSFGCFMYFFAGGIFDFMGWTTTHTHLQPGAAVVDIKRVIVSVISGVAMLFIEMILFVIRTHEMDKAMRHKQAKQARLGGGGGGSGAFGPYSAKTARDFKED